MHRCDRGGIVMFGSTRRSAWGVNRQRHQEIVERLAASCPVTYLELSVTRNPSLADVVRRTAGKINRHRLNGPLSSSETSVESLGIRFTAPRVAPLRDIPLVRAASKTSLIGQIRALPGVERSGKGTVLWACQPCDYVVDAIAAFEDAFVVYDVAQYYRYSVHMQPQVRQHEDWLVRRANLVIVDSPYLGELLEVSPDRLLVVPQGVSRQLLEADGEYVERLPIAGYLGSCNQALDLNLLIEVASHLPEVVFELVGCRGLQDLPSNVRTYDSLLHSEIASVLDRWTVGLIPYKVNDFTSGVLPTKALEYLARGLRVVSTSLPSLQSASFPGIEFAVGSDEFARVVEASVAVRPEQDGYRSWLLGQTWDERYATIVRRLNEMGVTGVS